MAKLVLYDSSTASLDGSIEIDEDFATNENELDNASDEILLPLITEEEQQEIVTSISSALTERIEELANEQEYADDFIPPPNETE